MEAAAPHLSARYITPKPNANTQGAHFALAVISLHALDKNKAITIQALPERHRPGIMHHKARALGPIQHVCYGDARSISEYIRLIAISSSAPDFVFSVCLFV